MMQETNRNLEADGPVGNAAQPIDLLVKQVAFVLSSHRDTLDRECWLPRGWPAGRSICVASSRLGRKLDQHDHWFDAIRTLAVQLNPETSYLVTSAGTTSDQVVRRIAQLFGIPLLELIYLESAPTERWKRKILAESCESASQHFRCFVWAATSRSNLDSQPVLERSKAAPTKTKNNQKKLRSVVAVDDDLIGLADEVYLLSVRPRGNVHRAAIARLQGNSMVLANGSELARRRTWLLIEKSLSSKKVERELLDAGALAWWLYYDDEPNLTSLLSATEAKLSETELAPSKSFASSISAPVLELNEIDSDNFLIHWTRRRNGPWPGQSFEEYLDDLIFQTGRRQHHEIATLRRIVAMGRIEATRRLTRVAHPVVCFADINLGELDSKQIFRSHLGRWDFLPYGIAIERKSLRRCGARPVIYGDEATWESLDEHERPFFQLAQSNSGAIDWRDEHEWRLLGDLDLNQFDVGEIVVFVKKATDALSIAEYSRWPIVVLNCGIGF